MVPRGGTGLFWVLLARRSSSGPNRAPFRSLSWLPHLYRLSAIEPDRFWGTADWLHWAEPFQRVQDFRPPEPGPDPLVPGRELLETTCRLANALKAHRIQKGDRVAVYMLVSPLAVAAMLACARIGAVHTVAFAGFSSQALAGRIQDVGVRLPRWRRVWLHGGHRLNHRTQPPLSCWTAHLCTWIQVSRVSSTKTPCFTYTASSGGKIPHSPLEAF
ncbi:acetyl-coenzyme A synthetase 2-like, mitochondrial isoform X3 [Poecilia reticulata]|uniref:acetyl-coenzyme A synthetase 2-like, mitochondrial isoform X3 n=1 Tax=Poecilia reticulata TaxID=8081 RepID=UPI0007EA633D|nr:PREDICTED: acetyl-coenzyme A synthetase 2-like, mitochondrial isoform X3 [Poecilia reticulata]